MKGSLRDKLDGGMKGSLGDNVWYGRTSFVRIRRYESAFTLPALKDEILRHLKQKLLEVDTDSPV